MVRRFAAGLRARFDGRLLGVKLFGSYARGEAHALSDVDLFVLLDRADRADRVAIFDLSWRPLGRRLVSSSPRTHLFEQE